MAWFGDVVSVPFGVASDDSYAPVTRSYRHVIAWGVAIALHLMLLALVAGVSLPVAPLPDASQSLDVVLVSRPAATPERATAIAEASQRAASTDTQSKALPATLAEGAPNTAVQASQEPTSEGRKSEQATASVRVPPPESSADAEPATEPNATPSRSGRELAASATASVREQNFTMSAPSTELADRDQQAAREAAEARYEHAWVRRVQDYGNRFYPAPSDMEGQLKVRVVIDHRGQLLQAEVIQSSGHPELDQAALDTIRGAAPYRPFDRGMAGLDRLSISRIWRFGTGNDFGVR